jgi:hypothetical protein
MLLDEVSGGAIAVLNRQFNRYSLGVIRWSISIHTVLLKSLLLTRM